MHHFSPTNHKLEVEKDKNGFMTMFSNTQDACFVLLDAVTVNQSYSMPLVLLLFIIDFFQLVSFPVSYAKSTWGITFMDIFSPKPIVNAYHNDSNFLPFVMAMIVVTSQLVLVVYGIYLVWGRDADVASAIAGSHWVFKVWSPLAGILMTVGYMPLLAALFGFAWSLFDGSISNNGGGAVGGVIVLSFTLVFVTYTCMLTATVFQRKTSFLLARPHARVDVVHFLVRTVLVLAFVAFGADQNLTLISAISLICSLTLAYSYTVYLPYYDFSLSRVRASIMWVVVVFNAAVIVKEIETLEQWGSVLFLYTCIPLAIVTSSFVISRHYKEVAASSIGKLSSPYLVELKCRAFLACDDLYALEQAVQLDGTHHHTVAEEDTTSQTPEIDINWQPMASFQEQGELLNDAKFRVVRDWYTQAARKFPQSSTLFFFFAQHLFDVEKDHMGALSHVRTARALSPLWDQAHLLDIILKDSEALLHAESAQFLRYISYRNNIMLARRYDTLATKARVKFLKHVAKDTTGTDLIFYLGSELETAIKLAKTHYDAAFAINRTTCPDLRAFGRFLTKIYQFPEMGQSAFKSADRIDAIRAKAKKSTKLSQKANMAMSVFDSDNGVVCTDEAGVVVAINDAACRILGYQASDMVARPWASMAPRPFSNVGNDFLFFHTPISECNARESPRRPMFLSHKAGHAVPVMMDTRRVTVYDKDIVFVSVIRALNRDADAYVITDAKGCVASWSDKALTMFPSLAAEAQIGRFIPDFDARLQSFEKDSGGLVKVLQSESNSDSDETSGDDDEDVYASKNIGGREPRRIAEPHQLRVWAVHDDMIDERGCLSSYTVLRICADMDAVSDSAQAVRVDEIIHNINSGRKERRNARSTINQLAAMDDEDTASEASMGKKSLGFSQISGSQVGSHAGDSRYARSSRHGRSEFGRSRFSGAQKVDVGWLRSMFGNFPHSSLHSLTFIAGVTCLVVAVAAVTSYFTVQSFTDQYANNMDVLYQAQLLRADLAIASAAVRTAFLSSLGVSKVPATDLAEARLVLTQRANLMHTRFAYLIPAISEDAEQWQMAYNATLTVSERQETHTYTTRTVKANLQELIAKITDNLKLLAQEEKSVIGSLGTPNVYYFLNNDNALNTALNRSSEQIATHEISKMDGIRQLEVVFATATLLVVFLAIVFAWRPAVSGADAERRKLLAMIYEVPRHVIKRLLKQTQTMEEDENSDDGETYELDENSDDDINGAFSGNQEEFSAATKQQESSNLMNQVRIFSLLVLCLVYFLSMMAWSLNTMDAEKARAHRTVMAGSRLEGVHRMQIFSRAMISMLHNPTNPFAHTSPFKPTVIAGQARTVNETRTQHNALLYGNEGWKYLGRDQSQTDLYFGSNCIRDVAAGFVSPAGCQTWYNGINTYGLDAVLERYLELSIKLGTYDQNPTYNTTIRAQLLNGQNFQFITEAETTHLRTGLEYSLYRYNADSVLGLRNLLAVRVWIMFAFLGVILAVFLYVHLPLIRSLNSSTTTTKLILLNIPLDIIRSVPQLNLHLETSIQAFNATQ